MLKILLAAAAVLVLSLPAIAQGNYEIQVYPAETVKPGSTMIELHSNLTVEGSKTEEDGVLPTEHQWHETIEITKGFTSWFETGFYIFTAADTRYGWNWVGDHIRPRVRVPEEWKWPVGVSVSTEIGYQRAAYSADTWTWEIRPIIDKQYKKLYLAFNPSLERSWHGPSVGRGLQFSPNFKGGWEFTKKISGGLEYYGMPVIRGILRESAGQNDRFSSIILGIVKSTPFQMRRKADAAASEARLDTAGR